MKPAPIQAAPPSLEAASHVDAPSSGTRNYREAGLQSVAFQRFFRAATHVPRAMRATRWFWMWLARRIAPHMIEGPRANARYLLGEQSTPREREQLAWQTVASFYDFVLDTAQASRMPARKLLARTAHVDGQEHYHAVRERKAGVIIVTAHLGNFEVAAAALRAREEHVHMAYFRDPRDPFEAVRKTTRDRLGLIGAPVNDGLPVWMALRDALGRDEAVLVQGDRVMPGQAGAAVTFLGHDMLMPLGPVKLALLSGAPLLPVFSVRDRGGRVRMFVEPAITVTREQGRVGAAHPAVLALADVIGRYVQQYPEQWHVLHPAWCADAPPHAARSGEPSP